MRRRLLFVLFVICIFLDGKFSFGKDTSVRLYFNNSKKVEFSKAGKNNPYQQVRQTSEPSSLSSPLAPSVDLDKISNELKHYEEKLCFSKKLSFKLWIKASAGAGLYVFSNNVEGGLEVSIDCSKK